MSYKDWLKDLICMLWRHDYESVKVEDSWIVAGLPGYKDTTRLVCKRCGEISECEFISFEFKSKVKE